MRSSSLINLGCLLSIVGESLSRPQYAPDAESEENFHSLVAHKPLPGSNAELSPPPPPPSDPKAKPVAETPGPPVPKPEPQIGTGKEDAPPSPTNKDAKPEPNKDGKLDSPPVYPGKPAELTPLPGPTNPGKPGKNGDPAGEAIGKNSAASEDTQPKPKGKKSPPPPLIEAKPPSPKDDPADTKPDPKNPAVKPPSGEKKKGKEDDWSAASRLTDLSNSALSATLCGILASLAAIIA
ncbi:hypothetical protein PGT21_008947 [Puccinia graminis f. sp. tritici]|uniref:Uncharacterized protein n=1 Tax=Puccinia graminis f. sp. tritici TaxID=56615 RepID=A0A5B0N6T6_PUCGR|nr:hypothetical protein PGTUg99_027767 [Puccinia graminis f. sp. tritici]KAA1083848.1 hypothetical protein PGT21_008947 [Puccinia graminis f. sp. tritici]